MRCGVTEMGTGVDVVPCCKICVGCVHVKEVYERAGEGHPCIKSETPT